MKKIIVITLFAFGWIFAGVLSNKNVSAKDVNVGNKINKTVLNSSNLERYIDCEAGVVIYTNGTSITTVTFNNVSTSFTLSNCN